MSKALKFIGNLIFILVIFIGIISVFNIVKSKADKNYISGIGSYKYMIVLSGSMSPVFNPYDVIVIKEKMPEEISAGDILSFRKGDIIVSHRVISVEKSNGDYRFKTKGDANNVEDEELVSGKSILGRYVFRIPYIGYLIIKLKGIWGVIAIWILGLYIIFTEVLKVLKKRKNEV